MAAKKPAKRRKALKGGKKLRAQKTLTEFQFTKVLDKASPNLF
jgi:type VI protein secretion system component Hcp